MRHLGWADVTSSLSSILHGHLAVPLNVLLFFFHEGKFIFITSGRTAALEAGNVYGELSAEAEKTKPKSETR